MPGKQREHTVRLLRPENGRHKRLVIPRKHDLAAWVIRQQLTLDCVIASSLEYAVRVGDRAGADRLAVIHSLCKHLRVDCFEQDPIQLADRLVPDVPVQPLGAMRVTADCIGFPAAQLA